MINVKKIDPILDWFNEEFYYRKQSPKNKLNKENQKNLNNKNDTLVNNNNDPLVEWFIVKFNDKPIYKKFFYLDADIDQKINHEIKKFMYFKDNKDKIIQLIKTNNFCQLKNYIQYDMQFLMDNYLFINLIDSGNLDILKYVLDNSQNLECSDVENWRAIHYICGFMSENMIRYIINKNVDNKALDNKGFSPINYIDNNPILSNHQKINLKNLIKNKSAKK